jgi:hypothetical protein
MMVLYMSSDGELDKALLTISGVRSKSVFSNLEADDASVVLVCPNSPRTRKTSESK